MFERFSEPAQQAIGFAREEARAFGRTHVASEHLLLGLLREGSGAAGRVLAAREITLDAARSAVERIATAEFGVGAHAEAEAGTAAGGSTAGVEQALEFALKEALALGHEHIGTEHILLGLLRLESGGVSVLIELEADPRAIRAELIRLVGGGRIEGLPGGQAHAEVATPPSFTAWLGTALTEASAEATADGRAIEVTDLLLTLVDDPQSPAGWVLAELGVDGVALRATAEHLRLLDREIDRVGREMHDASAAQQDGRAGGLRDQRRRLIAQRQRRPLPADEGESA